MVAFQTGAVVVQKAHREKRMAVLDTYVSRGNEIVICDCGSDSVVGFPASSLKSAVPCDDSEVMKREP